jgi:hypothetical protein
MKTVLTRLAAQCIGVMPSLHAARASAPCASSSAMTAALPSWHARARGVTPSVSLLSIDVACHYQYIQVGERT